MSDINEIIRLNPNMANGLTEVYEVLENIKELRNSGFAKGPDVALSGRHRKSLADLKPVQRGSAAKIKRLSA